MITNKSIEEYLVINELQEMEKRAYIDKCQKESAEKCNSGLNPSQLLWAKMRRKQYKK